MNGSGTSGGLWNRARPIAYSQETQELLKCLMRESHLTNGRKKQIRECLKNGSPLHLACAPGPAGSFQAEPSRPAPRSRASESTRKRSLEQCKAGGSYVRERFIPGPTLTEDRPLNYRQGGKSAPRRLNLPPPALGDREKEKERFQEILALGNDVAPGRNDQRPETVKEAPAPQEKTRLDEITEEIEEREQFLKDMSACGLEQPYVSIINSEISQRLRELELLDKSSSQPPERNGGENGRKIKSACPAP